MKILLIMSLFWVCYGILGIFGIQNIPNRMKNTEYEKEYKKFAGTGWLLIGIPWFVVWLVTHNKNVTAIYLIIILAVCAIPSMVYTHIGEKKYRRLLEKK